MMIKFIIIKTIKNLKRLQEKKKTHKNLDRKLIIHNANHENWTPPPSITPTMENKRN